MSFIGDAGKIGAGTIVGFKGIKDGISKDMGEVKSLGTSNIAGTEMISFCCCLFGVTEWR